MAKKAKNINEVKKDLIEVATEFLEMVAADLDPYTSNKSIIKQEGDNKVVMFTPSHVHFAKYGRGPGKNPPLDPIIEWINDKGIIKDSNEVRGTAFAIQKTIAKNGTLNYVPNAPNAMEEAISDNFNKYGKELADTFTIKLNDMILETVEGVMPKSQTYTI